MEVSNIKYLQNTVTATFRYYLAWKSRTNKQIRQMPQEKIGYCSKP